MGKINPVEKVKLFAGIIAQSTELVSEIIPLLEGEFGKSDLKSDIINFIFTGYYEKEMGKNLLRCWAGFEKLVGPEELARIKILTNDIEEKFSSDNKRKINIDPGYIALSRLVLASTKDFSHRIYLNNGVYAEVTMLYKDKTFIPLQWTYPDYNSDFAKKYFEQLRQIYHKQLHAS